MHGWRKSSTPPLKFQSAPAIAGGRCLDGQPEVRRSCRFNPRPPLLAGDAPHPIRDGRRLVVSIRARHCWRAMRASSGVVYPPRCFNPRPPLLAGDASRLIATISSNGGFNPRPPLLAGDAAGIVPPAPPELVSIRARHCWRAMRPAAEVLHGAQSFQSAPAIAGGRCASLPMHCKPMALCS